DLVPSPVEYAALVPATRHEDGRLPFLYLLHGGGGSRDMLVDNHAMLLNAWDNGTLRPCVIATPSAARSFYMDYRDGSQQLETLLAGPLLEHLVAETGATPGRESTAIVGISMGGMGGLRLAFRHADTFCAVAAL